MVPKEKIILANGASDNDQPGHNPINCAAEAGNLAVVEYFIEQRGVNVDVTDAVCNGGLLHHYIVI